MIESDGCLWRAAERIVGSLAGALGPRRWQKSLTVRKSRILDTFFVVCVTIGPGKQLLQCFESAFDVVGERKPLLARHH